MDVQPRTIYSLLSSLLPAKQSQTLLGISSSVQRALRLSSEPSSKPTRSFHLPAESNPHAGTIMTWPTKRSILDTNWAYPGADVVETRSQLAAVARAIAKYEPLHLFVLDPQFETSDISNGHDLSLVSATALLGDTKDITIHTTPDIDCLWARDTGPIFVQQTRGLPVDGEYVPDSREYSSPATGTSPVGLILSFNQWGRKNLPTSDSYFAPTAATELSYSALLAPFVGEGGAIEVDGEGTLLITESSILNSNRNPGMDKITMEHYFETYLGIKKTIWVPGAKGVDVTDDHIDALARFPTPGVVILSKPYIDQSWDQERQEKALLGHYVTKSVLNNATDAKGRRLRVIDGKHSPSTPLFVHVVFRQR